RPAQEGEEFLGIGMKESKRLKGQEVVISDEKKLVAIYPYRDADSTKIMLDTKDVRLLVCGVPKIEEEKLKKAGDVAVEYITRFCKGEERSV
ncbi:MAG: phenylalanine--tRNA ligase beta subunit-related protein, partial [Candidatus Hydrothermarchaeales archaeon]